ncbi:MAG TPA: PIN domain-containing protein [Pyrinomonadaceae bacterium]|nr:PIN domain-containing protein [Pyrinomonadaceae bacterium]
MRVLLDTNVVIDFVLARQPFFAEADEIFVSLQNNEFEAFVSSITPINVFYTTRKEKDKPTAFAAIEELLKVVEITGSDKHIFQNALALNFNDYEDAVQSACAAAENLDAIVTRNIKDYKNAALPVYSPADFLKFLQTV